MNLNVEEQRQSPTTGKRLVSMLETLAPFLTLTVVPMPMLTPRGKSATPRDRMERLAGSGFEDDLANATWEDAEWQ